MAQETFLTSVLNHLEISSPIPYMPSFSLVPLPWASSFGSKLIFSNLLFDQMFIFFIEASICGQSMANSQSGLPCLHILLRRKEPWQVYDFRHGHYPIGELIQDQHRDELKVNNNKIFESESKRKWGSYEWDGLSTMNGINVSVKNILILLSFKFINVVMDHKCVWQSVPSKEGNADTRPIIAKSNNLNLLEFAVFEKHLIDLRT